MRLSETCGVLELRAKILAKWREIARLRDTIAKAEQDDEVSEGMLEALGRKRAHLEDEASDLPLDYYCAAERAASRNPYSAEREATQ